MENYSISAQRASEELTKTYSTSFSSAASLFPPTIRQDIYNIYGLVRVADEIVDTYQARGAKEMLNTLEQEVYTTLQNGFSANIIVHAFCLTAKKYGIGKSLIQPFFASMRVDLTQKTFTQSEYRRYIYGSAEVVGLMCLKVFIDGDLSQYQELKEGAAALGAAFQKVNFLRDIKDDHETRGRYYFPIGSYEGFDEETKKEIEDDIGKDFRVALPYITKLPESARAATRLAYDYYLQLLRQISLLSSRGLQQERVSVPTYKKVALLARAKVGRRA